MKLTELAPALVALGRLEGSGHAYREAAKALRAVADQLDAAAKTADEQAVPQRKAASAALAPSLPSRLARAVAVFRQTMKGPA